MVGNYPIHLKSPFFFDVLFSCRHGAFHWAPILALGTIGLVWAARRESWALVLLAVLALQVYLIGGIGIADPSGRPVTFDPSNWNDHWKGGTSFGMRYLTECTPIFAAGLVVLFNISRSEAAMVLWRVGLAGLVLWNAGSRSGGTLPNRPEPHPGARGATHPTKNGVQMRPTLMALT